MNILFGHGEEYYPAEESPGRTVTSLCNGSNVVVYQCLFVATIILQSKQTNFKILVSTGPFLLLLLSVSVSVLPAVPVLCPPVPPALPLLSLLLMFRKKPPSLTVSEELEQLYHYACANTILNLAFEQSGDYETALKGWKSLHTLLLFKTDLYDKSRTKLSESDLSILQHIRNIRDENVKHLIRSQMQVDELSRRSSSAHEHGFSHKNDPSGPFSSSSSYSSSTHGHGPGKLLQLSMRQGPKPPIASNSLRSMRKSLRPGHSANPVKPSNSNRDAMGAANIAVHSMDNLHRYDSRHSGSSPSERTLSFPPIRQQSNPFNDFDEVMAGKNWHTTGLASQRLSLEEGKLRDSNADADEVNLIDLDDTNDFLVDYYASPDSSPLIGDLSRFDELSIKPTPPSPPPPPRTRNFAPTKLTRPPIPKIQIPKPQPVSDPDHTRSYSPTIPTKLTRPSIPKIQVPKPKPVSDPDYTSGYSPTIPTKMPYVYKKPTPINVQSLMKNAAQQKARPKTSRASSSMELKKGPAQSQLKPLSQPQPKPKSMPASKPALAPKPKLTNAISYNYVRAPPKKGPAAGNASTIGRKNTPEPAPSPANAAQSEEKTSHVSEEDEELINLIRGIDPTAARQILSDIVIKGDEVHWDDVVGLEAAKNGLKEAVVYPFLRPDLFQGLREPARGMLLFGPPGTGKTMLARAVATESKSTFFSISSSSLTSKYLGESEKLVKALFLLARKLSPLIVFIDEIDSLMSSRSEGEQELTRRIKNEFLVQWSELLSAAAGKETVGEDVSRVLILGATNLPWSIDEAARRRFMRRQYIPLPEAETRRAQVSRLLHYQNHTLTEEDLDELMRLTDGFSGSDITALAKDSAMGPLRLLGDLLLLTATENIRAINLDDFKKSLAYIRPSVSQEGISEYEKWAEKFGSSGA